MGKIDLTNLLEYLLADQISAKYSLTRKDEQNWEIYKISYDVHLVCTIRLPSTTAADALPSAWAKLTCAGTHEVHHRKDGSIVLK